MNARTKWILGVLAAWAGFGYWAGLLVAPMIFAPILLVALFAGSIYLVAFVWPHEDES